MRSKCFLQTKFGRVFLQSKQKYTFKLLLWLPKNSLLPYSTPAVAAVHVYNPERLSGRKVIGENPLTPLAGATASTLKIQVHCASPKAHTWQHFVGNALSLMHTNVQPLQNLEANISRKGNKNEHSQLPAGSAGLLALGSHSWPDFSKVKSEERTPPHSVGTLPTAVPSQHGHWSCDIPSSPSVLLQGSLPARVSLSYM